MSHIVSHPTPPSNKLTESPMGSSKPIGYQFNVRVRPPFSEVGAAFFRPLAPDETSPKKKTPTETEAGFEWYRLIFNKEIDGSLGKNGNWNGPAMKSTKPRNDMFHPDSCQRCTKKNLWPFADFFWLIYKCTMLGYAWLLVVCMWACTYLNILAYKACIQTIKPIR